MNIPVEANSEASFVLASVMEFLHVWRSGRESSLSLHCKEGKTVLNFQACLGRPDQSHFQHGRGHGKRKSANRRQKDNARVCPVCSSSFCWTPISSPLPSFSSYPSQACHQPGIFYQFSQPSSPNITTSWRDQACYQPGTSFQSFYSSPPNIPGCYQPGTLPRDHHTVWEAEKSVGAVRVGQHHSGTERDSPSLTG